MSRTETPHERGAPRGPLGSPETSALALMSLLAHDSPTIRRHAAGALGRIQALGVPDSLLLALYDRDRSVQQAVIGALGSVGDPRAIPPLRRLYPCVDRRLQAAIDAAQLAIEERHARDL